MNQGTEQETRAKIAQYLASFLSEERHRRLIEVIENRTRYITVVVEDLFQVQNISAVLRSCECVGIQDVHIIEEENEFTVHKAISMGADKWLNIQRYGGGGGEGMRNCIHQLKRKGYKIAATLPADDSLYLDEIPIDTPIAFLFGTELTGLSETAISLADCSVKIPMHGLTTSFNISNSVAIIVSFITEKLRKSSIKWQLSEIEKEELYFEWLQKAVKNPEILIKYFLENNNCL